MIRLVIASCLLTLVLAVFDPLSHHKWPLLDTRGVCGISPAPGPDPDNNDVSTRVANGDDAEEHEFPWMAQLMIRSESMRLPVCGGTLINNRYVLTAAHCVTYKNVTRIMPVENFSVRLGAHRVSNDCDAEGNCEGIVTQDGVEEIIVHGNYKGYTDTNNVTHIRHDIALIRLQNNVTFVPGISPVCLPVDRGALRELIFDRSEVIVAGFGQNNSVCDDESGPVQPTPTPERPQYLQKLATRVVHSNQCPVTDWNKFWQYCTRSWCTEAVGKGDSGGPLMVRLPRRNVYYQMGIISHGDFLPQIIYSLPNYEITGYHQFMIYTKVEKYMKWILEHIQN